MSRVSESCGRRGGGEGRTGGETRAVEESDRLVASHRGRGRLVGSPGEASRGRARRLVPPPVQERGGEPTARRVALAPRPRRGRAVLSSPRRLGQDHTTRRVHRGTIHRVHRAAGGRRVVVVEKTEKGGRRKSTQRWLEEDTARPTREAQRVPRLTRLDTLAERPRRDRTHDYCPTTLHPSPRPPTPRSSPSSPSSRRW